MNRFYKWLSGLFDTSLVLMAVVRRYKDANGSYVGELYMYSTFAGVGSYRLVGCSLDSLPLDLSGISLADEPSILDLKNDFLQPMPSNTLRVGAPEPKDNDAVRKMIASYRRRNIRLTIQNKFIEYVLEGKTI